MLVGDDLPDGDDNKNLAAKWLLNGFPKSGLHFCVQLMRPVIKEMIPGQLHVMPWLGTFRHHSWSEEWSDIRLMLYMMGRLHIGCYFKSHVGWRQEIEDFLWYLGVAHVFIYRDMRDVAVSQAHHVLADDNERFMHPDKELYRSLGGFDDVLAAVIEGVGIYPGVMHRWEYYAPWLEVPWVYKLRFEEAIADRHKAAGSLLRYGLERVATLFGLNLHAEGGQFKEVVCQMVESSYDTENSVTYRKGAAGGWREAFTGRHVELFKQTDTNNWLARLGYEW